MIYEFTSDDRRERADAIPDPKHVWIDGEVIRVYTGEDMPQEVAPE